MYSVTFCFPFSVIRTLLRPPQKLPTGVPVVVHGITHQAVGAFLESVLSLREIEAVPIDACFSRPLRLPVGRITGVVQIRRTALQGPLAQAFLS
ncbi:hypothetical protein STXM2123_3392 [Streptomyces sp. F-3]|nr:hypothetical protein STXM2123_3392 [Streptomyces sp. F-3]